MIAAASAPREIDCEIARYENQNSTRRWSAPLQYFCDAQVIAAGALPLVPCAARGEASAKIHGFSANGKANAKKRLPGQNVTPVAL